MKGKVASSIYLRTDEQDLAIIEEDTAIVEDSSVQDRHPDIHQDISTFHQKLGEDFPAVHRSVQLQKGIETIITTIQVINDDFPEHFVGARFPMKA